MGAHHTKDKGDLGVAKAFADLVEQGLIVLFAATEHAAFDLVAYDGVAFHRVQVKYRAKTGDVIRLDLKSVWSDRHGVHKRLMDRTAVDLVCIYCPDTDECYYVRPEGSQHITLRFAPSLNGQRVGVRPAEEFRSFHLAAEMSLAAAGCPLRPPSAGPPDPRPGSSS